jgi:hypothetical protein
MEWIKTLIMALATATPTPTSGIPALTSWSDLILIILFGIPVVIQLWRVFFVKPKIKLSALPPFEYHATVNFFNEKGIWENLGLRKVFITYLEIENNGKSNAKDCSILFTTPERKPEDKGKFVFPQDLPLIYTSIVGHGFEVKWGIRYPSYEILVDGKPILAESSQTIAQRGGKSTVMLLFVVGGFKQAIVTLAKGTAGLPLISRTIKLRTSVDGKLHTVKLEPAQDGSYVAEVLN